MDRRERETLKEFHGRTICSLRDCTGSNSIPVVEFPWADSPRLDQAPARCPRCAGLWRAVDEGYVCTQCGRRWRAGDCLMKLVSRQMAHTEAWPTVRMTQATMRRTGG